MDELTKEVIKTGTEVIIKKFIGETYDFFLSKYKLMHLQNYKDKYIEYCRKILYVKTLASPDKSLFINDIYVPLTLRGINLSSVTVTDATILDMPYSVILIKGLAGQGKSTILRKLLANNISIKKHFIIFYELKNYKGGDIEESLLNTLKTSGIDIDIKSIEKILTDSNARLYLDAFDETNPIHRNDLLDQFQKIYNKYKCTIICTSRPDTELDSLTDICTYTVDTLNQSQIYGIIHRTSADEEKADELCAALERSPLHNESESILKSPILVVLYCISYNLGEDIPSTLSQFYGNIFDTIFFRHDNLKGKVNRIRHWNDNRQIYRELFNCLCFISQRSGENSFNRESLTYYLSESLEYVNEDRKLADKIFNELASITNLIIEDGFNEYRFVHKSIQEFFSSSFICSMNHEKKCRFYKRCSLDSAFYTSFRNTLFFLKEMDYYDYCENYFIPTVSNLLNIEHTELNNDYYPYEKLIDTFINKMIIKVKYSNIYNKQLKQNQESIETYAPVLKDAERYSETYARLFNTCVQLLEIGSIDKKMARQIVSDGHNIGDDIYIATLSDLIKKKGLSKKEISDKLLIGIGILFQKEYNQAIIKLRNRESSLKIGGFFDF